jgi:hypothetical protein
VYRTNGYHRLTVQTNKLLFFLKLKKMTIRTTERLNARWYGYAAIFTLKIKVKTSRKQL